MDSTLIMRLSTLKMLPTMLLQGMPQIGRISWALPLKVYRQFGDANDDNQSVYHNMWESGLQDDINTPTSLEEQLWSGPPSTATPSKYLDAHTAQMQALPSSLSESPSGHCQGHPTAAAGSTAATISDSVYTGSGDSATCDHYGNTVAQKPQPR